jgi:hypothetical protein
VILLFPVRSASALFLTLLVLWLLLAQVNHSLAPWHVYLFAGGLFVTLAALELPLRPGFAAILAAGMVCDANAPVPFGTHTLMFAVTYAVLFRLRDRLPHEELVGRVAIVLIANFALFFGLTLLRLRPVPAGAWPRLVSDLLLSQVFVGLIAPWYFSLQQRALALAADRSTASFRA